jgi:2-polyprenyl-6-methoxyphenol hydroxylase-like FAD-dependent oxidoreductase
VNSPRPITIVGGGLAGLTLGIGLRQHNVPVTVFEAGKYPRHRVCGEFINGQGVAALQRLGLLVLLEQTGVRIARTTAFHSSSSHSGLKRLPTAALCISRWSLDAALATEFRRLGGELREHERWHDGNRRHQEVDELGLGGRNETEFIVHASGRRMRPSENGWRWLGVKAHASNISLQADLEMFLSRDCYVGVSWLPNDEVNVCGLFRRRMGDSSPASASTAAEWFTRIPHPRLQEHLAAARFDESSFCSVAGLSLRPQRATASSECRVGDAITMIPPLSGNGMSMAFESAEIAIKPLVACCRGEISWIQAQRQIAHECDVHFTRRLKWAHRLQALALSPLGRGTMLWFVARCNWFWQAWFQLTR